MLSYLNVVVDAVTSNVVVADVILETNDNIITAALHVSADVLIGDIFVASADIIVVGADNITIVAADVVADNVFVAPDVVRIGIYNALVFVICSYFLNGKPV